MHFSSPYSTLSVIVRSLVEVFIDIWILNSLIVCDSYRTSWALKWKLGYILNPSRSSVLCISSKKGKTMLITDFANKSAGKKKRRHYRFFCTGSLPWLAKLGPPFSKTMSLDTASEMISLLSEDSSSIAVFKVLEPILVWDFRVENFRGRCLWIKFRNAYCRM